MASYSVREVTDLGSTAPCQRAAAHGVSLSFYVKGENTTELKIRRRRVSMTAGGSEKSCQITSGQPS